ncbi:MAG: hypothetical protein M0T82_04945, partial [Desulfobacteraceae bacterium]|nr:hypothetical protein [Desulfobacteraceae bacterium]
MTHHSNDNSWREFQSEYIVQKKKQAHFIKTIKSAMGVLTLIFLFAGIFFLNIEAPEKDKVSSSPEESTEEAAPELPSAETDKFSKEKLFTLLSKTDISKTDKNIFLVDTPEAQLKISTSI